MDVERCAECGFDGSAWTDSEAIAAIGELPERWADAVAGVDDPDLLHRPFADRWSIGEYADHVRGVLFGMRFVLDIAISSPGTDLGPAPPSSFSPEPAAIDVAAAIDQLRDEAGQLARRLSDIDGAAWSNFVGFDGAQHDVGWIARHAVHDATHHLVDVRRLRDALDQR